MRTAVSNPHCNLNYSSLSISYFDQILQTYACQHCLTTGMRNSLLNDRGFAERQYG